jgi:hypothetical protein
MLKGKLLSDETSKGDAHQGRFRDAKRLKKRLQIANEGIHSQWLASALGLPQAAEVKAQDSEMLRQRSYLIAPAFPRAEPDTVKQRQIGAFAHPVINTFMSRIEISIPSTPCVSVSVIARCWYDRYD